MNRRSFMKALGALVAGVSFVSHKQSGIEGLDHLGGETVWVPSSADMDVHLDQVTIKTHKIVWASNDNL